MQLHGDTPSDMSLYHNEDELLGDDKTLIELGISPNSLVIMKVHYAQSYEYSFSCPVPTMTQFVTPPT